MKECMKLWCAVLNQAIKDVQGDNDTYREDATKWFNSEKYEVGSFLYICQLLDYDELLLLSSILPNEARSKLWPVQNNRQEISL